MRVISTPYDSQRWWDSNSASIYQCPTDADMRLANIIKIVQTEMVDT